VDEWQLAATSVWNHVRAEVDQRSDSGQFILAGSATPDDDARRHSGAGRFARLLMRPMSLFESGASPGTISLADLMAGGTPAAASALTVPDLVDLVIRGGWPTNIGRPLAVAEIATAGSCSASTAERLFMRHLGMSIGVWMTQHRMSEAALLLRTSGLRVGEVAQRVGYPDALYFSRVFRRTYGVPPRQYAGGHLRP
jgi:AraC-like DNA-binding protein